MTVDVEQNTGIFHSNTDGFAYSAADETFTIDPTVTVGSGTGFGVSSQQDNSVLINYGNIFSFDNVGVEFSGPGKSSIANETGATIRGTSGVIDEGGGDQVITNRGTITGTQTIPSAPGITVTDHFGVGVEFGGDADRDILNNNGRIFGLVDLASTITGGTINNNGLITGGISIFHVDDGQTTFINNSKSGIIATDIILGDTPWAIRVGSQFSLTNFGKILGSVLGPELEIYDHDVVHNYGLIKGDLQFDGAIYNKGIITGKIQFLDNGINDTFIGTGGHSGAIFCGNGYNRIIGGTDNDQIHVGVGNAVLTGAAGADRFFFDHGLTGRVDRITDFTHGVDKIVLSEAGFAGIGTAGHPLAAADFHIGTHATTASQHIIYNPINGFLFYDPDGNGAAPQTHFATVGALLPLTNHDVFVEA
jgi:Ca2+-binding RTX toxin-like protein